LFGGADKDAVRLVPRPAKRGGNQSYVGGGKQKGVGGKKTVHIPGQQQLEQERERGGAVVEEFTNGGGRERH